MREQLFLITRQFGVCVNHFKWVVEFSKKKSLSLRPRTIVEGEEEGFISPCAMFLDENEKRVQNPVEHLR